MKKRNIEEEIQTLDTLIRDNEQIPSKLRNNILKQVEVVRKCAKPRRSNKGRNQNQNSGLLKPVSISEEMARFANWGNEELHSRVDVTKIICVYIKTNKLQKPSNKKTILPDKILKELLRWDSENMNVSVVDTPNVFSITEKPNSGLKKESYYNNSELRNNNGEEVAIIKKMECLENGNYMFTFDREDVTLKVGEKYVVHVPLTYPKVQTKISVHLSNPRPIEEVPKKETKKTKPKKETDKKSKKNKESDNSDE